MEKFQDKLSIFDDWGRSFKKLDPKLLFKVEDALSKKIPMLMKQLPALHREQKSAEEAADAERGVVNPFGDIQDYATGGATQWAITGIQKSRWDNAFADLPVRLFLVRVYYTLMCIEMVVLL